MVRSPRDAKASPRDLPIWISDSTRANSPPIGPVTVARHLEDGRVESLTGLDTDGEHVERVGEPLAQLLLALGPRVVDQQVRQEEAGRTGCGRDE